MTDLQKQNLSSLIKTSPILNDQERGEWLMLLDLMNDKQVGELERILKPAVVVTPTPIIPAKTMFTFVPPPVVPNLPLKHIVNLPSSGVAKAEIPTLQTPKPQPISPVKPILPKPAEIKPAPDKTFSKFAEHLNKILAEKDLPVAEQEKELPPPPPAPIKPPVIINKPISLVKPVPPPRPIEQPKPIIQQPKPVEPIKPIKPIEQPKTLEQLLSSSAPVVVNYDKPPTAEDLDQLTSTIVKSKPKPASVRAGLQNQDMLFQAAVYKQPKPVAPPVNSATPSKVELSASLKLQESVDVAGLQLGHWTNENHIAIAQALKKIIAKSGYHEVIFNLQKSPLYNLYIDTGLKSLESPKRFEDLGENFLNKKQFEDFTDMLRELQI